MSETAGGPLRRPLGWLRRHDPGLVALRRAGRAAIVMPTLFAFGDKVIGDATLATFAAFGSFAMLLLVDFTGRIRDRVEAHLGLCVVGAVFICVATPAARSAWIAAAAMAVVAFVVLFVGVVSSVLAGASTALLLAFILPVSLPGPFSSLGSRLAGWGLASAVTLLAITVLWPAPARDPLRTPTVAACRELAARLRSDVAFLIGGEDAPSDADHDELQQRSDAAVSTLRRTFLATPFRPTGLSTPARTLVRLVDELSWLNAIVVQATLHRGHVPARSRVLEIKLGVATLLERAADVVDRPELGLAPLQAALDDLRAAQTRLEESATRDLPIYRMRTAPTGSAAIGSAGIASAGMGSAANDEPGDVEEFVTSLEPTFRAMEMSFAASQIGGNVGLAVAAAERGFLDRWLGRQPGGLIGPVAAAHERAFAHFDRHSVWLHNSIRGAVALGLAVLVADLSGVQHAFWVVLATLSVLRSNALNIGQNAVRGLAGTAVGFVVGAGLLALIGTNTTVLWVLLPLAILFAGVAPAAISFAAGQAAFTITLVILFNIIAPAGWRVGLVRVEDIAIGCVVSLAVGLLFWPRGAATALRRALAEAYADTAHYLSAAVEFGLSRCDVTASDDISPLPPPTADAVRAAAASRRLDDTFRSYLAERGTKTFSLSQSTSLVSGVLALRLAGDAVLDLWQRDHAPAEGDRSAARAELLQSTARLERWYDELAGSFLTDHAPPSPLEHDQVADGRLLEAVRRDLRTSEGAASPVAARMIWTGDHLDAVRRLQVSLA